jgi:hypothetical protein
MADDPNIDSPVPEYGVRRRRSKMQQRWTPRRKAHRRQYHP